MRPTPTKAEARLHGVKSGFCFRGSRSHCIKWRKACLFEVFVFCSFLLLMVCQEVFYTFVYTLITNFFIYCHIKNRQFFRLFSLKSFLWVFHSVKNFQMISSFIHKLFLTGKEFNCHLITPKSFHVVFSKLRKISYLDRFIFFIREGDKNSLYSVVSLYNESSSLIYDTYWSKNNYTSVKQ